MPNIATWLEKNAREHPEKVAVKCAGQVLTNAQFDAAVNRLANGLVRLGVKKGDRVSIMLPNSIEFLVSHYAAIKCGAAAAPVNVMLKREEIKYVLNNAASEVLIIHPQFLELVEAVWTDCPHLKNVVVTGGEKVAGTVAWNELLAGQSAEFSAVDCAEDDMCDLYYTAGTTGRPKGVMITHKSISKLMEYESAVWKVTANDHMLVVLPLFHTYALVVPSMLASYNGATQTILERWDTEQVMQVIQDEKITFFAGVPTMFVYMVRHPRFEQFDLTCLRICKVGGAAIPVEVQAEFEKRAKVRTVDGYGCTGWVCCSTPLEGGPHKHGTIGMCLTDLYPASDTQMKVVDDNDNELPVGEVGELIVKGSQLPIGFWKMPATTARTYRNGWFHTGDMAVKDEDGFFRIVDRKDDLIITSGYNVYPREVEEAIYTHPAVSEVGVAGIKDQTKGQLVKAFVVLKPGQSVTAEEIIGHCRERLANYKVPRMVEFVDALPKTATGKLMRRALRGE